MPSTKKKLRSRCPVGFEAVSFKNDSLETECPVLEDVLSDGADSSLWLIKVPHDFDLSSLSGQNVVLNGSQDLCPNGAQDTGKRYEVQSKTDCGTELSSFTVLLPSLQQKTLSAAGSLSGQMSVIRSVSVPPPTLPESSLSVQRQPPNMVIRKWKPFGYSEPQRKREANKMTGDSAAKRKKTKEPKQNSKDESRKHTKELKEADSEKTVNDNAREKTRDSSKKKKNDQATHEVDLARVKIEPGEDERLQSPRKRKAELNKTQGNSEEQERTKSKKKKKKSSKESIDVIVKQEPVSPDKDSPPLSRKLQYADSDEGEMTALKQKKIKREKEEDLNLTQVRTEHKETKKKKHSKTKTC